MRGTTKSARIFQAWLLICLILGLLAQIETIKGIFRPVLYASWMAMIAIYIICSRHRLLIARQARILIVMVAIIYIWRIILMALGQATALPQLGTMLLIDVAAFLCGGWLVNSGTDDSSMAKILIYYSAAVGFFSIYLFRTYFSSIAAWITTTFYQYSSKNSAAQLLVQAVVSLIFLFPAIYKKRIPVFAQIFRFGVAGMLLIVIGLLRCRTAMLALAVGTVYNILRWGKKRRILYVIIILLLIMMVLIIEPIRQFVESALLLNKYGSDATLDQFSSGRLTNFKNTLEVWKTHPWIGVGKILIDCNPLALLTDSGVLGAIPYFVFWFSTVKTNLLREGSNPFNKAIQFLTIYYCVSSLLEGYPPFGPGVCVAPLWLLSGYGEIMRKGEKNEVICSYNDYHTNI